MRAYASFVLASLAIASSSCRAVAPEAAAAEPPEGAKADTAAVPVRLAPVAHGPVARPIRGTGVVRLKSEVDLSFKTGGIVAGVFVEEGAKVKRGQVLARLDATELGAAMRQATDARTKAERDLERVRRLHAGGALPEADLQDAETGASMARAAATAAAFNVDRTVIVAPDDGRVDRRMVEPGEVAAPGRPLFHFSGRSRGAVVRVALVDKDVLRVRDGGRAWVTIDARSADRLAARVVQIATVASPGSGTFDVELRLDEAPSDLLSGLTAKAEIERHEEVEGVVPITSLVDGRGKNAAVFVEEGGRARKVPVTVAFLDGDRAAIARGVSGVTSVVAAGAAKLEDGDRVRLVP